MDNVKGGTDESSPDRKLSGGQAAKLPRLRSHVFKASIQGGESTNSCVQCGFPEDNSVHYFHYREERASEEDQRQDKVLAELEGKAPPKRSGEDYKTTPLMEKHESIPMAPLFAAPIPPKIGTWCLWCEYITQDVNELEKHMKDHILTGYTPALPLNKLLKWLGSPAQKNGYGNGVMIQIVSSPANDITKKVGSK